MRFVSKLKKSYKERARVACSIIVLSAVSACGNGASVKVRDAVVPDEGTAFHADNDIAMTISSIVDAVRVGETLDSSFYNFTGILTDGQGTPLYTDVDGAPGEWSVKVLGDTKATVKNLYVGDLMADDLRSYILGSLHLNSADLVSTYENPEREGERIYLFDSGDVNIAFSSVPARSASGLEGWLMSITVSK